jgi:uncharacterized protein YndB with AHSA1/START domain
MKVLKWIAIVVAVLLFVPLATLLVLGHRANAGHAQASAEINASPEQLWTWIDDGDKLKQWVSWLVDVKYPDAQRPHGTGSTRVLVMKDENSGGMLMQITGKYGEYTPPSRLTVHLTDSEGMFDGEQAYQLTSLGNGRTRLEIHSHYHFSQWFASLMEPVITPQAERKLVADVARLKLLVESQAALR